MRLKGRCLPVRMAVMLVAHALERLTSLCCVQMHKVDTLVSYRTETA